MAQVVVGDSVLPKSKQGQPSPLARLRLAIVAFSTVAVLGYGWVSLDRYFELREEIVENALNTAAIIDETLEEHFIRTMQGADVVLGVAIAHVERGLAAGTFDRTESRAFFAQLKETAPQLRVLAAVDENGKPWLDSDATPPPDFDVSQAPFFKAIKDNPVQQSIFSAPRRSPVDGQPLLPLERRINYPGGGFAGMGIAVLDPGYFEGFYSRLHSIAAGISIHHIDGTPVVTTQGTAESLNTPALTVPLVEQLHRAPRGSFHVDGDNHAGRYIVYQRVKGMPYVLVMTLAEEPLLAATREEMWEAAEGIGAIGIASLLLTWLFLRATYRTDRLAERLTAAQTESEAARARMADWAEGSNDWFWESDANHRISFTSEGFFKATGMRPGERLGGLRYDAIGPVTPDQTWRDHLADIAAHRPFRDFVCEAEFNGRRFHMQISAKPLFDGEGRFLGYRGSTRNVTAMVAAEMKLRESEERNRRQAALLQDAIDALGDGFVLYDAEDRLVMCNERFREIRHVNPMSSLVGARFTDILRSAIACGEITISPDEAEAWIARRLRERGHSAPYVQERQGRWIRVSERRTQEGGVVAIHSDITDMKVAETKLRESEERFRSIASNLPLFQKVVRADRSSAYTFVSDLMAEMSGYSVDQWLADPGVAMRNIAPEFLPAYQDAVRRSTQDMKTAEIEFPYTVASGEQRWARSTFTPRRLPNGDVIFDGTVFDITRHKRLEQQRIDLEIQLRQSQKLEALGTLAGGIAHDVNNTLVPILALSKMVLKKLPPEHPDRESLQTILDATYRARDLVSEILAFSRKDKPKTEIIWLQDVIDRISRLTAPTLPPRIRLSANTATKVAPIAGDENQIAQVLMNLCNNAAHAIGEASGSIHITLDMAESHEAVGQTDALTPGRYARLTVADTGCGMDPRTLSRIFEPFFTTKRVGEGTGLGLSVVHGIINSHGGRISAESEPGRGTIFTILLPLAPDEGAHQEVQDSSSPQPALV